MPFHDTKYPELRDEIAAMELDDMVVWTLLPTDIDFGNVAKTFQQRVHQYASWADVKISAFFNKHRTKLYLVRIG
jgi:2-succinyl-5-enolpyruvyl-6-hydroxy-3-cyclohexene-1-carboxylate synthase